MTLSAAAQQEKSAGFNLLRSPVVLVVALILIFGFYCATQTEGHIIWSGDFSMYVAHARNLATGRPYADTGYIFRMEGWRHGGSTYPSGYPLLLAPVYALFGENYRALKTFTDAILVLSLAAIYLFARRTLPGEVALVLTLFLGMGFMYLSFKDLLAAEGTYLLASYGALCLLYRIYDLDRDRSDWLRWGLLMGVLLAFVYMSRSIGVALFFGVCCYDLYRNRRISRFLLVLGAVFIVCVVMSNWFWHHDSSYGPQISRSVKVYLSHILGYPQLFSDLWINGLPGLPGKGLRLAAFAVTSALALVGLVQRVRKGLGPAEFYLVFYGGVIIVYHGIGDRYLLPVMPLYLIYAAEGAGIAAAWVRPNVMSWARIAAVVFMAFTVAGAVRANLRTPPLDGTAKPTAVALWHEVKTTTRPNDIFIFWDPRVFALFTGRRCAFPGEFPPAPELAYLESVNPNYVVLWKPNPDDQQWLEPAIQHYPERFQSVYENADFQMFRFLPRP